MIIRGELYRFTHCDRYGQLFIPVRERTPADLVAATLWECMCNGSLQLFYLHPNFYERVEAG
jgi:hypothetical protein